MNRRDFLKTIGRWSVLGILGYAGLKNISFDKKTNDKCISNGVCSYCNRVNDCGHPSAVSYKQSR